MVEVSHECGCNKVDNEITLCDEHHEAMTKGLCKIGISIGGGLHFHFG